MFRFTISLILIFVTSSVSAFESYYYTTKAKQGEGVYAMLRRYDLDTQPCNFQKFYELNSMEKNDGLKIGASYLLPIKIIEYNGTSIRSTLGMEDWATAVEIKEYNEHIKAIGLRKTHYVDSKILWVPHHLMECESGPIPETEPSITEATKTTTSTKAIGKSVKASYLGDKYATIPLESTKLKGKVYYIVSGHGGIDPGAMCTDCLHTLCEDEYAYDVSLRLSRELLAQGATVHQVIQDNDGIRDDKYLACDTDEYCMDGNPVPANQKTKLAQRTNKINELYEKHKAQGVKEQYAIFLHVDSNHKNKRMDVYFFHAKGSRTGEKLAKNLQDTFRDKYAQHQADRGYNGSIRSHNLYVVNNTIPPAILVELGNIKNPNDQKRIIKSGNRQALADWIAEGLATFEN